MRVALLQLALNRKSMAANTQSLLAGIGRAAQATPAPDLLVLPGAGGAISARSKQLATTFLRDPEGNMVVSADSAEETTLHAEVPLVPSTAEVEENVYSRGRQAD